MEKTSGDIITAVFLVPIAAFIHPYYRATEVRAQFLFLYGCYDVIAATELTLG